MLALVESVIRDLSAFVPGRKASKAAQEVGEQMVFARTIAPGVTEMAEVSEILTDAPGTDRVYVAETFTGASGKYVSLKDTIAGFRAIVDGEMRFEA